MQPRGPREEEVLLSPGPVMQGARGGPVRLVGHPAACRRRVVRLDPHHEYPEVTEPRGERRLPRGAPGELPDLKAAAANKVDGQDGAPFLLDIPRVAGHESGPAFIAEDGDIHAEGLPAPAEDALDIRDPDPYLLDPGDSPLIHEGH